MDETPSYPHIPCGQADFRRIRLNRWLYVDKTRFLRRLEQEHYAFLIRPRRFGKSLWVSLLENYYDRFWADDFDATFAVTDIGRDPTGDRAATSRCDSIEAEVYGRLTGSPMWRTGQGAFSAVNDKLGTLEREFELHYHTGWRKLERHPDLFPEAALPRIVTPSSFGIPAKINSCSLSTGRTRGRPAP